MFLNDAFAFLRQVPSALWLHSWEHRTVERLSSSDIDSSQLKDELRCAIHEYSVRAGGKILALGLNSMEKIFRANHDDFPYFLRAMCKEAGKPIIPFWPTSKAVQTDALQVLETAEKIAYKAWTSRKDVDRQAVEPTLFVMLGQHEKNGTLGRFFNTLSLTCSRDKDQKRRAFVRAVLGACTPKQREHCLDVVRQHVALVEEGILNSQRYLVIDRQEAALCALLDIDPAQGLANLAGLTRGGVPVVFSERVGAQNNYCIAYQAASGGNGVRYRTGAFVGTRHELLKRSDQFQIKVGPGPRPYKRYRGFADSVPGRLNRAVRDGKSLVEAIIEQAPVGHPLRKFLPLPLVTPAA